MIADALQVVPLVHATEEGLTGAAAASDLQWLLPPANASSSGSNINTSTSEPAGSGSATLLVPAHVELAFQPSVMGSSSRSFAAPEHWMVLWSCTAVAAALRVDAGGCSSTATSPAALATAACSAALNSSSAEVVQRYRGQGGHDSVFQDAPWRPNVSDAPGQQQGSNSSNSIRCSDVSSTNSSSSITGKANGASTTASSCTVAAGAAGDVSSTAGAAQALLQHFLSSAQLEYTNLTSGSRDVITPVP